MAGLFKNMLSITGAAMIGGPATAAAISKLQTAPSAITPPTQTQPQPTQLPTPPGPVMNSREQWLSQMGVYPQIGRQWGRYDTGPDGMIPRNTLIHPFNGGLI